MHFRASSVSETYTYHRTPMVIPSANFIGLGDGKSCNFVIVRSQKSI